MFKLFGRKSSFKKDFNSAQILLNQVDKLNVKIFLEVGVYQGVTARNICELLKKKFDNNFQYIGIDLFEDSNEMIDLKESTSKKFKISNPFKYIYYKYLIREDPCSLISVKRFLKKFDKNILLKKGFSHQKLEEVDLNKVDFCFLDGGHSYETVKKDLDICLNKMRKKTTIVCDDYNILGYGVKQAIDEISSRVSSLELLNKRLAKITI